MKTQVALLALTLSATAAAQEPVATCNGTCVPDKDMKVFVGLLKEKECLQSTVPSYKLDPINVIVDRQGRIFFSGAAPHPYKMHMEWCGYAVDALEDVKVVAAVQEPPAVGFHFRPKAYSGFLLAEPFRTNKTWKDSIDAGLMLDAFYIHDFNLNVHAGFRAVGVGVGVDVFRSFGGYAGYAVTWDGFHSNPEAALWFAFW